MSFFASDRPVTAGNDAFNRLPFATALATALMHISGDDGLVIGLEGGWGTGKSSIIEFLKHELAKRSTSDAAPVVVHFNPWMVSNTGALVDALVTQIAAATSAGTGTLSTGVEVSEKLLSYVGLIKHFKHLKYLKYVPGAGWIGNLAEDVSGAVEANTDTLEGVASGLDDLKNTLPTLDISKRREEVVVALKEFGRQIIVVVDDLDRLPAEEIRLIVQAIKAVADFPSTTYLMAYDHDVVARALGNGDVCMGAAYLEKIVQVVYPVPPVFRHQLRRHTGDTIQGLLGTLQIKLRPYEKERWNEALKLVTRLIRQPRDIIRLRNRLVLSLPATHGNVNAIDVIVLEALSQRFPSMRESIYRYPVKYISRGFRGDDDDGGQMGSLFGQTESSRPTVAFDPDLPPGSADAQLVREICEFLFLDDGHGVPENSLRVANRDRLARYFHMTSLESVPDATEVHRLLNNPADLADFFDNDSGEEDVYVQWMIAYLPTYSSVDVAGSIGVLAGVVARCESRDDFTAERADLLASALIAVLAKADRKESLAILAGVAAQLPIGLLETVIGEMKILRRREGHARVAAEVAMLESRILDEWSARVVNAVNEGLIQDLVGFHRVLWRHATVNDQFEYVYNLVTGICSTDDGLAKFLAPFHEEAEEHELDRLIRDPDALVLRISSSPLAGRFAWFAESLASPARNSSLRLASTMYLNSARER